MRISAFPTSRIWGQVTAPSRAQDTIDMSKILFGDEFVANNTVLTSLINANSPMTWDDTMLGALKVYARNNQATDHFALYPCRCDVASIGCWYIGTNTC
jgi:trimethylamine:corrinoid methyltransferase-like protein